MQTELYDGTMRASDIQNFDNSNLYNYESGLQKTARETEIREFAPIINQIESKFQYYNISLEIGLVKLLSKTMPNKTYYISKEYVHQFMEEVSIE